MQNLHEHKLAALDGNAVTVCGRPATDRVEVYSPAGGITHGSLDANIYACPEHTVAVRDAITAAGRSPFTLSGTEPGPMRCGDGYDFVRRGPLNAPASPVLDKAPATTADVAHYHVAGWGGVPGECGVECACGVTFDNFDSIAEAAALLDGHIARANRAAAPVDEPRAALVAGLRELADFLEDHTQVAIPPAPSLTWAVGPHVADDAAGVACVRDLAAALGVEMSDSAGGFVGARRSFGPLEPAAYVNPEGYVQDLTTGEWVSAPDEAAPLRPTSTAGLLGTAADVLERHGWQRPGLGGLPQWRLDRRAGAGHGLPLREALLCALAGDLGSAAAGLTPPQQGLLVEAETRLEMFLLTEDLLGWQRTDGRTQADVVAALRIAGEVAAALHADPDVDAGQVWAGARIDLAHEVAGVPA